ncbi:hypothetical protein BHE74_00040283, partial [Ensete ventricosum]
CFIKLEGSWNRVPYRPIHTGSTADQYADRPLQGGTAKIDRRLSIDGEIDRRRSIEEEKGKRRKKKKYMAAVLAYALPTCPRHPWVDRELLLPSTPAGRPRALAARGSPARRRRPCSPRATIVPALGERPRRLMCPWPCGETNGWFCMFISIAPLTTCVWGIRNVLNGKNVAKCIRAVFESLIARHFRDAILDELFARYAEKVARHLLKEKTKHTGSNPTRFGY